MEWTVMQWIDDVIQEPKNRYLEYPDCIKDGIALCKLMEVLDPGSINADYESKSTSASARVDHFRQAALQYGVPEADMFDCKDLLDKQNVPAVTSCLQVLAQLAEQRGFQGPRLSPTIPSKWQQQNQNHLVRQIFH